MKKRLKALLSDREELKLELWNDSYIATYKVKNHTLHVSDESLDNLLDYLIEWRRREKC
ncbi:MAG: hypothetical protein KKD77_23000 [Gammaproteobacteria bacterium]|nr:hypothetical protein [Gammaproteobacteria bacterium]